MSFHDTHAFQGGAQGTVSGAVAGAALAPYLGPLAPFAIGGGAVVGGILGALSGGKVDKTYGSMRGKIGERIGEYEDFKASGDIEQYAEDVLALDVEGIELGAETSLDTLLNKSYDITTAGQEAEFASNLSYPGSARAKLSEERRRNEDMVRNLFKDVDYRKRVAGFGAERERIDKLRAVDEAIYDLETKEIEYT
jgi:hypothetical protein